MKREYRIVYNKNKDVATVYGTAVSILGGFIMYFKLGTIKKDRVTGERVFSPSWRLAGLSEKLVGVINDYLRRLE